MSMATLRTNVTPVQMIKIDSLIKSEKTELKRKQLLQYRLLRHFVAGTCSTILES